MKIVIAAASGNIGRRTAEKVVQAGAETIVLTRQPEKLADLVVQGAIALPISSDDTQGLIEATQKLHSLEALNRSSTKLAQMCCTYVLAISWRIF